MDHRDTMNTERGSRNRSGARPVPGRSGNIGAGALGVPYSFGSAGPLRAGTARAPKASRRARLLQSCKTERRSPKRTTWERHSGAGAFPWSMRRRVVPVPEGLQRRLAGGKSAPADAAPGTRAEWLRAPAGHRRNGLECRPIAGDPIGPRRRVLTVLLRDGRRQKLLRCPAGAWPVRRGNRGPRPLERACPRLISCGVPPGPRTRRRRQFSGRLIVASATARSSRRTSRSGLAPGDASDSNGHLRGFWAAAAGPRRTQPRSLGCGFAALCSSCLCGPIAICDCIDTAKPFPEPTNY